MLGLVAYESSDEDEISTTEPKRTHKVCIKYPYYFEQSLTVYQDCL
jgi:hypothetical protein